MAANGQHSAIREWWNEALFGKSCDQTHSEASARYPTSDISAFKDQYRNKPPAPAERFHLWLWFAWRDLKFAGVSNSRPAGGPASCLSSRNTTLSAADCLAQVCLANKGLRWQVGWTLALKAWILTPLQIGVISLLISSLELRCASESNRTSGSTHCWHCQKLMWSEGGRKI